MGILTTIGKNTALTGIGTVGLRVRLHSGAPGATGTDNQISGGTYEPQAITWNTAAAGNLDSSNQPVFDIPASTTVSNWSLWNVALDTCYAVGQLSATEVFTNAGTYTLTDADITLTDPI